MNMRMKFTDVSLDRRIQLHNEDRVKWPDKISLWLTLDPRIIECIGDFRLNMLKESTVGQVIELLKKKIGFEEDEILFLVTERQSSPTPDVLLSDLYHEMKNEDGFLYLAYCGEGVIEPLLQRAVISLQNLSYVEALHHKWEPYFKNMRLLFTISETHESVLNQLKSIMTSSMMDNLCLLFILCSTRADRKWVFQLRNGFPDFQDLDFHDLVAHVVKELMFVNDTDQEVLQLTLDMSHLLEQSMEQIGNVNPTRLHGNISVAFRDDKAQGAGVFAHWFLLVCDKLFDPKSKLFIHSPDDLRRFSPTRLSSPREDQIISFKFAGRFIALALRFGIQLGILLDPIFFRRLAGLPVVLEDIGMTDAYEMKSYKKLLNMDENEFSENIALNFTVEIDNVEIPLCPDGENMLVTFDNRDLYVRLRVQKLYVNLVEQQVQKFGEGFGEMMHEKDHSIFFKTISLGDMDGLLRGEQHDVISIEDWRAHTVYEGFKESDQTIITLSVSKVFLCFFLFFMVVSLI